MKTFKSPGLWYLPGDEKNTVAGTLQFSRRDGLRLTLTGSLGEPWGSLEVRTYPVIYGVLRDSPYGRMATLEDSFQTSASLGIPGFSLETIHSNRAFIGNGILENPGRSFSSLVLKIAHLVDWLGYRHYDTEWNVQDGSFKSFSIRYAPVPPLEAAMQDYVVRFVTRMSASTSLHAAGLREGASIEVDKVTAATLTEMWERFLGPLHNLVTFAADMPCAIEDVVVSTDEVRIQAANVPAEYHVLGAPIFKGKRGKELMPADMLFSHGDLPMPFEKFISAWMAFCAKFRSFCNAYFSNVYRPPGFSDARFLHVYRALELLIERLDLPPGVGSIAVTELRAMLASSDRGIRDNWHFRILPSEAEADFPWHLSEVLRQQNDLMKPLTGGDTASFVDRLLSLRDMALFREDPHKGPSSDLGSEFHWMTEKVLVLIKALMLKRLDFPEDTVVSLLRRNRSYVHLKSLT
jgi:hypothetical protein